MADEGIKLAGLNATVKALREIGVPDDAIKTALQSSADIVAERGRSLAPVRSGALRGSIRTARQLRKATVRAGNSRVPYANPIHWGWFYDRENFIYKNIRPNPFLARALGYERDEIIANFNRQMQALIDKYN
jgi:hypothetical protein